MAQTQTIGSLLVRLLFDDTDYQAGIKKAGGSTKTFGNGLKKTADFIQGSFVKAFKLGTLALVGFGAAAAVVGSNFEQAMSRVAAVRGIEKTSKDFEDLENKARELGATTNFSATQAAQGMEELARAGLEVSEILAASNDVLKLAAASDIELADAAKIVASSMSQFKLDATESTRVVDVLTAATQNSQFDMKGFAAAMKFAGTTGKNLGMSIEETSAAVAQFRNLGIEGSMAGRQFRIAMSQAAKPTEQAEAALAKYNLTAQQINPELRSFREIMLTVGEAGLTVADAMEIFGREAGSNVLSIANSMSQTSEDFDGLLSTLENAAGTTEKTYEIMTNNVAGRFAMLRSVMEELLIGVFDTFAGPLNTLLQSIIRFVGLVAQEVSAASGSIGGDMESVLGGIADVIDRNAVRWAQQLGEIVLAASSFARILSNNVVPVLEVMLPLVDDIAFVMATIWATQKAMAFAAFLTGVVIPAIGATTFSLSGMAAALTAATGGVAALVAGFVVIMSALAVFIVRTIAAEEAVESLAQAQEQAAARAQINDKVVLQGAARRLSATKEALIAEKETLAAAGELTKVREKQIDKILKMDAASAALAIRRGELLNIGEKLVTTEEALTSEGVAGQKRFAAGVETTKASVEALKGELERAGSAAAREQISKELQEAQNKLIALRNVQVSVNRVVSEAAATADKEAEALSKLNKGLFTTTTQLEATASAQTKATKAGDGFLDLMDDLRDSIAEVGLTEEQSAAFGLAKRREGINAAFRAQVEAEGATGDRLLDLRQQREDALQLVAALGVAQRADVVREAQLEAAEKEKKEAESAAKERAEKVADVLEDAQTRHLKASERLAREFQLEVLPNLAEVGAEERLAIEEDFSERIKQLRKEEGGFFAKVGKAGSVAFRGLKTAIGAVGSAMSGLLSVGDSVLGLFQKLTGFSFSLADGITAVMEAQKEAGGPGLQADKGTATGPSAALTAGVDAATDFVADMLDNALSFIDTVAGLVPTMIQKVFEALPVIMDQLTSQLPVIVQQVAALIPQVLATLFEVIPQFISVVIQQLPVLFDAVLQGIMLLLNFLVAQLPTIISQLLTALIGILDTLLAKLPEIITQLLAAVIGIIDVVLGKLPEIITMVLAALPQLIQAILTAIPQIITSIMTALPGIIISLIDGLLTAIPLIIVSIIEAIPPIVMAIVSAIPSIVMAILSKIPDIITSVIAAIPVIIIAVVKAIPVILQAVVDMIPMIIIEIIKAIPQIILSVFKALFFELPKQIPKMVSEMFKALVQAIKRALEAVGHLLQEIFQPKKAEKRREEEAAAAALAAEQGQQPEGSLSRPSEVQGSAYTGIAYVPATMKMTLHKGDVVKSASEGVRDGLDPALAGGGNPARAFLGGGAGGQGAVNVNVFSDGRIVDSIQKRARDLGRAPSTTRFVRRSAGMRVGLKGGKFNRFNK